MSNFTAGFHRLSTRYRERICCYIRELTNRMFDHSLLSYSNRKIVVFNASSQDLILSQPTRVQSGDIRSQKTLILRSLTACLPSEMHFDFVTVSITNSILITRILIHPSKSFVSIIEKILQTRGKLTNSLEYPLQVISNYYLAVSCIYPFIELFFLQFIITLSIIPMTVLNMNGRTSRSFIFHLTRVSTCRYRLLKKPANSPRI